MDITPSLDEKEHSQQLIDYIVREIAKEGGHIAFSRFMELALYQPGLGYYSSNKTKLGAKGDFTTAPELSDFFGAALCQTIIPALYALREHHSQLQILEFGAGSGVLARSILKELSQQNISIDQYNILDLSADLKNRQEAHLKESTVPVRWLHEIPASFVGVIIANEVIDAIPVDIIRLTESGWKKLHVKVSSDTQHVFDWHLGENLKAYELPPELNDNDFPIGYTTEIHPQAHAWMKTVANSLEQGLFLTLDYGFAAREYYHPQRSQGTLICHYRHHAVHNPFYFPGLCDITAHVNWSAIAKVAMDEGLHLEGYTSQTSYLLDAGIGDLVLSRANPSDSKVFLPISNALQKLLSEAEMGELFKALCLSKNLHLTDPLPGFGSSLRAL